MLIARQAINVVVPNVNETATADALFETSNTKVRPWVDYAFAQPDVDAAIKKTEDRLSRTTDTFLRGSLQNDLDDLKLLKAMLSNKPKDVKEIEAIILDDLKQVKDTSEDTVAAILHSLWTGQSIVFILPLPTFFPQGAHHVRTGTIRARPHRGDDHCQRPPRTATRGLPSRP
jgi:hypothetical protein